MLTEGLLLLVLLVFFGILSYRILKSDLTLGYALGWLVGILLVIIIGSLGGDFRDSIASDGRLTLSQVLLPLFCGVGFGLATVAGPALLGTGRLAQSMRAALLTAITIIAIFLVVVGGPALRRMATILALTVGVVSVAGALIGRYIRRTPPGREVGTGPIPRHAPLDKDQS